MNPDRRIDGRKMFGLFGNAQSEDYDLTGVRRQ